MDVDDGRMSKTQLFDQLRQLRMELERTRAQVRGEMSMQAIMHELEVHQEEVRMQNEQLKETQRALEESCERYSDLYDFAPLAYVTLDGNGVIKDINLTGTGLLGVERSKLLESPLLVHVLETDRHILLGHLVRCRRCGPDEQVTTELKLQIRRAGSPMVIPAHLVTRRGTREGQVTYRTAITDMSERHKAEVERRALLVREETARAANDAKDRFLAMLSHELRTPLTPVLAAVTAMELETGISPEIRGLLNITRRNIELEAKLIDDLLDVTRISRGKLGLTLTEVDLDAVVHDVKLLFAEECAAREIHCSSDHQAEKHHVRGDPVRLRQVVWNLVKNAIKFTPRGGGVTIRTANDPAGRVVLSVSDTGIGIEPSDMSKLFAPFEQASTTLRPLTSGLGLGLFICKALVEAHGGEITATSPGANKGSTFSAFFDAIAPSPAAQSAAGSPAPAPILAPAGWGDSRPRKTGLGILLVEDHPDTARVMAQLLKRHGHHVKLANNVKDAVSLTNRENQEIDLIISDLGLPDGSGMDLIRQIQKDHPIPGIALSGYGTDEDVRRSREAGFSEHLVKPVNFPHLLAVVDRLGSGNGNAIQSNA
jgi:hypothetical protein